MSESIECPNCEAHIDTADFTEHWLFNEDVFHIRCNFCSEEVEIRVALNVKYEVL